MTIPACPECQSRLVERVREKHESGVIKVCFWLCHACGWTWGFE
jgi:RNase P subunit RPR2